MRNLPRQRACAYMQAGHQLPRETEEVVLRPATIELELDADEPPHDAGR